jgi:hypothetical protein
MPVNTLFERQIRILDLRIGQQRGRLIREAMQPVSITRLIASPADSFGMIYPRNYN